MMTCGFDSIFDSFYKRLKIMASLLVYFVKKWVTPANPLF